MADDLNALQQRAARIDELHRCRAGRTALLVIDMQHGFLDPGASLEVAAGRDIVPNLQKLIAACRAAEMPVIFTEFVYAENVPCLRGDPFGVEHLPPRPGEPAGFGARSGNCLIGPLASGGAESADTIAALAPRGGELVVRAHTYDKFFGTPLDLALRSRDIRYLLLTGVTTDVCVNATLIAAAMRDYRVTAAVDGVAAPAQELHDACLKIWERKFARLRTTDELVREIAEIAGPLKNG